MTKFRLYFDKDKETKWLNEMSMNGYAMTNFCMGFYQFENCTPGKYIYQIDFKENLLSISKNYRDFMSEIDIEIVDNWFFWIYLRKEAQKGSFELYTDVDSSIEHYTKIRNMFKALTIIEIICLLMNTICAIESKAFFPLFFLSIIVIGLMDITFKTNQIITELKERKGEFVSPINKKFSPLLISGMVLNCALMGISINHTLELILRIFAIALMLAGLYQSGNILKKEE